MMTPMIARLVRTPFDREGWFFELKWDGFRCIAEKDRQVVRLYSRNQNDFKKRLAVIAEQISAHDNVILDGVCVCARGSRTRVSNGPSIGDGRLRELGTDKEFTVSVAICTTISRKQCLQSEGCEFRL